MPKETQCPNGVDVVTAVYDLFTGTSRKGSGGYKIENGPPELCYMTLL